LQNLNPFKHKSKKEADMVPPALSVKNAHDHDDALQSRKTVETVPKSEIQIHDSVIKPWGTWALVWELLIFSSFSNFPLSTVVTKEKFPRSLPATAINKQSSPAVMKGGKEIEMKMETWLDHKVVGTTVFTVPSLYHDLKPVGMGAFGLVCSAKKRTTGELPCAIKKIAGYVNNLANDQVPSTTTSWQRERTANYHC
jgi:hypothetical protein